MGGFLTSAGCMQKAIDHIDCVYSGIEDYLVACSVSIERQEAVKKLVMAGAEMSDLGPLEPNGKVAAPAGVEPMAVPKPVPVL